MYIKVIVFRPSDHSHPETGRLREEASKVFSYRITLHAALDPHRIVTKMIKLSKTFHLWLALGLSVALLAVARPAAQETSHLLSATSNIAFVRREVVEAHQQCRDNAEKVFKDAVNAKGMSFVTFLGKAKTDGEDHACRFLFGHGECNANMETYFSQNGDLATSILKRGVEAHDGSSESTTEQVCGSCKNEGHREELVNTMQSQDKLESKCPRS